MLLQKYKNFYNNILFKGVHAERQVVKFAFEVGNRIQSEALRDEQGKMLTLCLSHIGYYRLSAYMYPLFSIPKEQHLFKRGVSFGNLVFLLVGKTNHCGNKRYMTIRFIRITKASQFSKIGFCRIQLLST